MLRTSYETFWARKILGPPVEIGGLYFCNYPNIFEILLLLLLQRRIYDFGVLVAKAYGLPFPA